MLPNSILRKHVYPLLRYAQRRMSYRQVVHGLNQIAEGSYNLDQLTEQIVNLIQIQLDFYQVGLYLVDATNQQLVYVAGTGEPGRILRQRNHRLSLVDGQSFQTLAFLQNEIHALNWVTSQRLSSPLPLYQHWGLIAPLRTYGSLKFFSPLLPLTWSELAIPLRTTYGAIGLMEIHSSYKYAGFSRRDIALLLRVADQVALMIRSFQVNSEFSNN